MKFMTRFSPFAMYIMIAGSVNGYHYSVGVYGTGIKIFPVSLRAEKRCRERENPDFTGKETRILKNGVESVPIIIQKLERV